MTKNAKPIPLDEKQRTAFAWLDAPHLKRVAAALEEAAPGGARYVGGCVRDSLMGAAPKDFDIATTLEPDAVMAAAKAAGLGVVPTGIEHGTVTVIVDHQGVEVTTLRADVSTDGRRATVAFTEDWSVDAGRRDFTINAIYLSPDGLLYDPVDGLVDIQKKNVRFIGDPEERIREDYLRILRFFRFSARFASAIDVEGLAAATKLREGVKTLSAERIGAEFMTILALPRAVFALDAMVQSGVLPLIWEGDARIGAVERLKDVAPAASAPVVLAALFGETGEGIGARLRLSNAEKAVRSNAVAGAERIKAGLDEKSIRRLIYQMGRDTFFDAIAVAAARRNIEKPEHRRLAAIAEKRRPPAFPYSGKDVLALGVKPGPAVARILSAAENQWIAEDFPDASRAKEILVAIARAD